MLRHGRGEVFHGEGILAIGHCRHSTAYELSKHDKSLVVIDRGRICGGMTSRTSAHLAPLCDDLVSEMIKIKGKAMIDTQAPMQKQTADAMMMIKGGITMIN